MSDRAAQFRALYRELRIGDQRRYYEARNREYAQAHNQAINVRNTFLLLAALAGAAVQLFPAGSSSFASCTATPRSALPRRSSTGTRRAPPGTWIGTCAGQSGCFGPRTGSGVNWSFTGRLSRRRTGRPASRGPLLAKTSDSFQYRKHVLECFTWSHRLAL
jgi:hypothetical protein